MHLFFMFVEAPQSMLKRCCSTSQKAKSGTVAVHCTEDAT